MTTKAKKTDRVNAGKVRYFSAGAGEKPSANTGKTGRPKAGKLAPTSREVVMKHLVKLYQMARSGYGKEQMCVCLNVAPATFDKWRNKFPEVRAAIEEGRKSERTAQVGKFRDYIIGHLPKKLRKLWRKIMKSGIGKRTGTKNMRMTDKLEKILKDAGKPARQQLFLYALVHSTYNLSVACRRVNVSKRIYESWLRDDPNFRKMVEEIEWHKENFFEDAIVSLVAERNPAIVKFAAQSKLSHRGYGNRKVIDKNVTVSGSVVHEVKPVSIGDMKDLSLEEKRKFLEQYQVAKEHAKLPPRVVDTETVSG